MGNGFVNVKIEDQPKLISRVCPCFLLPKLGDTRYPMFQTNHHQPFLRLVCLASSSRSSPYAVPVCLLSACVCGRTCVRACVKPSSCMYTCQRYPHGRICTPVMHAHPEWMNWMDGDLPPSVRPSGATKRRPPFLSFCPSLPTLSPHPPTSPSLPLPPALRCAA